MKNESVDLFLKDVYSREDVDELISQISAAKQLLYSTRPLIEQVKKKISPMYRDKFLALFDDANKKVDPRQLSKTLIEIEQTIKNLPQLRLKIVFACDFLFLEKLSAWFEENFDQKVIFEIIIDPSLIAGCIIEYQGKYKDYSIASTLLQNLKEVNYQKL